MKTFKEYMQVTNENKSKVTESQDDIAKKAKQIRSNPDKEFIDYMMDFYGPKGLYIKDFTVAEIKTALAKRKTQRKDIPFEGDSFDRELVRDYVLAARGETNLEYNVSESEIVEEVQELEEASKVKPFIKKVGKKSWAIKIEALGSDQGFPEYNFGQQIDPSRKVKTWKDGAKSTRVDAKGKATLQAVKDWIKENNPTEFYASWESDSSSYKDDSVEIFYK